MNNILIGLVLGLAGYSAIATVSYKASAASEAVTKVQLGACGARLDNLLEDIQSDNSIDELTDHDLRSVPAEWLLLDIPPATD